MKRILSFLLLITVLFTLLGCQSEDDSETTVQRKQRSNTVALTIGEHQLNNAEMTYYYRYAINYLLQSCGGSIETANSLFGVDLYQPLDQQKYYDEDRMWSDYFIEEAIDLAVSDYTMADLATAEGYTMRDDEVAALEYELQLIEDQAQMCGYPDTDEYVQAYYGKGSDYKSFVVFLRRNALAESYRKYMAENFPVPEESITKKNTENFDKYSSFSYNYYDIPFNKYLTADENAAEAAAKEAAELLAKATTAEEFDKAIAELAFNKELETAPKSIAQTNVLYDSVPEKYREWIAENHKPGDTTIVDLVSANYTDDTSTETVTGYTVVLFVDRNDNYENLNDVRQIFVALPEDPVYGGTANNAEAYEVAKQEAEAILAEWRYRGAREEDFANLAAERSDDQTAEKGLYENISRYDNYPSEFFSNQARAWAVDPNRLTGDVDIVESDIGYHILFYVDKSADTYRIHAIKTELRTALYENWYNDLISNAKQGVKQGNLTKLDVSTPPFAKPEH